MRKQRGCAGLVVLLLAFLSTGKAQTYGEITGTVTDISGSVLVRATVTVRNTATRVERRVETNEVGNYNVPFLNPGVYNIAVELSGFRAVTRSGLTLEVGDVARVNFTLELGAVTETVEVAANAVLLQTESTATGTVIEQKRIVELPLNGRNFLQLVRLSPNVSAEQGSGGQADSRQGGERANQSISIAGQRQQYNQFTLDGVENTDPNFNTYVVRPSVEALQEFKVQTGVYSAEFGKATSQINATTRAGTNQYHASLFEFLRNDAIQAKRWLVNDKNPFRRNQFGFTFAGPAIKDKLFFMTNYEGLRDRTSREARATVATTAMRNGDFSGPGDLRTIYDPDTIRLVSGITYTATPFPDNKIPAPRFKKPFLKLLEFYPEPNVSGALVGISDWNFIRRTSSPTDWDQFTSRIDFAESANSQWFGRLSWGDEGVLSGSDLGFNDSSVVTKVWQAMVSNARTLTPSLVNELRVGFNFMNNARLTSQFNGVRDISKELGIPGLDSPAQTAWGQPSVSFNGFTSRLTPFGESNEGPYTAKNRTYQILDNVSWVRGKHTLKFGGEAADRRFNNFGNQFERGNLAFAGRYTALPTDILGTGHGFASGLLGWMSEATRALGTANLQYRQRAFYGYFEDSWKIRPTLTLTLGIRYENVPPWSDRYRGAMSVKMFCPGTASNATGIDPACQMPVLVRPGNGDFHQGLKVHWADIVPKATGDDALCSHALVCRDNNDWAPRIGLAWQPTSKTAIRTGYGIYYGQDTGNPVFDLGRNIGTRDSNFSVDPLPVSNLDDPWGTKPGGGPVCSNWSGPCVAGLYSYRNDPERRTPYVQQYIFNIQRQLSSSLLLEVGYQGNKGTKIQRMYGFNKAVNKSGPDDTRTLAQRQPFGANVFGIIQTIGGGVNSNYNALSVKVQQRFTRGVTYLVGYTWSRSIDNGSAIRTQTGDNLFPANNYNFKAERGLSQFHAKQRLTTSVLYELPLKFQHRALETAVGGWQVGSILTLSAGSPYGGGNCGDINSIGEGNRGDATGLSIFPENKTQDQFFTRNPATGRGPAGITCNLPDARGINQLTYRSGNVNRNPYIGPGVINWDFSMTKSFKVTERAQVEFRFESFNFANHPNWDFPDTGVTSLTYGRVTSAREMRTNQFGLKFLF